MDPLRRMQSLYSPALLENRFEARRKLCILYAENPGALAPNDSRFATRIASSTAARYRVAVWSWLVIVSDEALTSMDHYAEGPGKFTWWTVWRMQARTAHNQTTERELMITRSLLGPGWATRP
jgi:hypothetical protein